MIICRDCGHQNEDDDQFCGSCGSFLEFTGEKQVIAAVAVDEEEVDADSWKEKAKRALDVADENVAGHQATSVKMQDDDAQLAAAVVAREEAARAEEAERVRAEEAAKRLEESNAERARADERAREAERELEELRQRQVAEEAEAKRLADEQRKNAERELAAKVAAAEEEARVKAQLEREQLEQRLTAEQKAAEDAQRAAAEAAEKARVQEEQAEAQRKEIERQLEAAAAAAAAAALRASQERDAVAAADAARIASEAEAQRSRIAAEAAAAQAAEDVARIRAEAEAAKAEAAELRAQASAEASRNELERQQLRADREAAEQAAAARRRVEEQESADRERRDAEAHATMVKAQAEHEAAQRKAEAELEAKKAEAEAAKARAEEERARLAAEAEAAKRDREEALRRAASLVAPKVTAAAAPAAASVGVAQPTKSAKSSKEKAGKDKAASSEVASGKVDSASTPSARLPGSAAPKMAPKKVRDAELNPGDLVCGQCGSGNLPARKFCRKCGSSLVEAKKAKLGLFARLRSRKRRRKQRLAGDRKGIKGAATGARNKGRKAWYGVARLLSRIGAVLAVFALLGFGVEPIRQKLHLPNVRQKVFDVVRKNAKPIYDPIRPSAATASSTGGGTSPSAVIDLGSNTSWMAKPTPSGGVGSRVTVTFEKPVDIARVLLTPGLAESTVRGKGFVSQPRPSELRVTFNDDLAEPQVVKIADDAKPQVLNLKHKETRKVTFEISQVYPAVGGKGKSVALTEIEFFERRKIGDNFEKLPKPQFTSANRKNLVALGDENLATSWVTAKTDDGVGQGFGVVFAVPTDLNRIRIAPGNDEATFQSTPRPHEVQLAFTCQGRCPATKQVSFKDKPGFKDIGIDATGVTRIDVIIRSVYGTGDGAAFAEIEFLRKRPPAN